MEKHKVIVIGGPTAYGKTSLSIELAKKINGEIVSADSMQIYKEMNIGTAKPDILEMQGIKHSVADYKRDAKIAIKEIIEKGKMPIVVGGTGLYIDSLIYEIDYPQIETDLEYRKELQRVADENGLQYLYEMAKKIDEKAMEKISENDSKRILRVLELYKQTGKTKTELELASRKEPEYDYKIFAITMEREILYDRINKRVDIMIKNGLVEEVQSLYTKYKNMPTAIQGLGYKEVIEYIEGKITKDEMIEKIKRESRRYAKRQLTWFRKNKEIVWLDGMEKVEKNIDIILEETKK